MAYLITCSGSKQIPEDFIESALDNLSYNETLLEARQEILNLTGIELTWNNTLPAWKLYSGNRSRLYNHVSEQNWNKPCTDVKILSALFGWIKHTDFVPYYNLKMTDRVLNRSIWSIWYDMNILEEIINTEDIDLLSQPYRKAIHGSVASVANHPGIVFHGYGDQHGKWLNKKLTELAC
jgi:cytoplasmic iron level regulating protein YaaA (DUF328/UPF0246 family)